MVRWEWLIMFGLLLAALGWELLTVRRAVKRAREGCGTAASPAPADARND
jgi:hypothetical protein